MTRVAGVALESDHRNDYYHITLPNINKATHSTFETQPKGSHWPHKRTRRSTH